MAGRSMTSPKRERRASVSREMSLFDPTARELGARFYALAPAADLTIDDLLWFTLPELRMKLRAEIS